MDADFVKKRLEKDLLELKKMIDSHFEQRKKDESELTSLEDRIEKRKDVRMKQQEQRQMVKFKYFYTKFFNTNFLTRNF